MKGIAMAQDDMFVVMYKILAYLYDCMKKGMEPRPSMLAHDGEMLNIDQRYWARILKELADHGYVSGVIVRGTWEGELLVRFNHPTVTMEGVEFLQENSTMRKALEFLKETKSAIPLL